MKISNDVITSRNNPKVKWASQLQTKKGRLDERTFIAEGEKLSIEALDAGLPVTHIFLLEEKKDAWLGKISKYINSEKYEQTEIITLSDNAFEKISTEKAPEGVISVIKYLDFLNNTDIIYKEEFFLKDNERAMILCSVRDPGNLGAVIRSATAFGVDHLILSSDCAEVYNPKTVRASMGSLFRTKITSVSNLEEFIKVAKECGRNVYAAELTDKAFPLSDISLNPTDIFIIGNEGHGIPQSISALCNNSVYIPISKKTESLNAAVAAAVFMWEQSKK